LASRFIKSQIPVPAQIIEVVKLDDLRKLLAELLPQTGNINWPPHLFMPESAIRFGQMSGGTSAGTVDELIWSYDIPVRHKSIIHWLYLKPNTTFLWKLKVNGAPDPEYGNINYANTDPATDGWLMPLGNARIVVKGSAKITLYLTSTAPAAYSYVIRGYYWFEDPASKELSNDREKS
jgi:hypothetical protein